VHNNYKKNNKRYQAKVKTRPSTITEMAVHTLLEKKGSWGSLLKRFYNDKKEPF